MNKKSWILLLILVLVLSTLLVACGKKSDTAESGAATSESGAESSTDAGEGKVGGQVVVGSNTAADGNWNGWGYWGNNATDNDVASMISLMELVQYGYDGDLQINKAVVESHDEKTNDDGSKTHTFKIKKGLEFSDGTPITAKNYVAQIFFTSPQIKLFEAKDASEMYKLVGHEEFNNGLTKEFKGIRLLDDQTFSLTIAKEYVPDFYELLVVNQDPLFFKAYMGDDADIKDDGNGVYIDGEFAKLVTIGPKEKDDKGGYVEPERTEEQKALFDKFKAIVQKARDSFLPSSGPYILKKFDKATKEVVLERNEKYPGNFEGKKPKIQTVIIREAKTATQIDQLKSGEVDLLRGLTGGDEINAGISYSEESNQQKEYITYPRAGFGMIHFHCDFGPTRFKEVRQAIAHLLDRNDFVQKFTAGFGTVVDGPYGEGQWFYKESQQELQSSLNHYSYSLEKAVELLEKAGYTLNEKGEAFTPGTDKMRYRKNEETGELEPLLIKWASTKDNPVSETLVVTLQKNKDVATAGMVIEQDVMDFGELLGFYNRAGSEAKYKEPTYNMFNLASGFPVGNLPSKDFTTDPEEIAQGLNVSYLIDPELDKVAKAIKNHKPEDREGFRKAYVEYFKKWNELLPEIPLYSNTIHDFYDKKIKNYNNSALSKFSETFLDAYVEE